MASSNGLFARKCTLQVTNAAGEGLDLSEFRIVFNTTAHEDGVPGTAVIRIYNLRPKTVNQIRQEYQVVTLQAGYETGPFAAIFIGSIKQFRVGKENATTTYLDLLCADQDVLYNATAINKSIAAGSTPSQVIAECVAAGNAQQNIASPGAIPVSINPYSVNFLEAGGIQNPRGKVLYGSSSDLIRSTASAMNASWSVQKGVLQVVPFDRYLPTETVVLSQFSGVVGIPEVTNEGIKIKCLLNPLLQVGGTVTLNNALVNQIVSALGNIVFGGVSKGIAPSQSYQPTSEDNAEFYANVGNDGALYRMLVIEYEGDTRGQPWYANITCLLIDASTKTVITNPTGQ